MTDKIVVDGLFKVFGPDPRHGLKLAEDGVGKHEIFSKTKNTVGVYDAGFSVQEGEIFVVMGLSGSGKSTLVRMFNRLIEPTAGSIKIDGRDVVRMDDEELIKLRRGEVGMVFQSFALMPHLSVVDNAAFGLAIAGVDADERRERALGALKQVGLEANADSRPSELSGGMQQRVGLARALAHDPSILLMDEAFSALDPLIRTEMQDELLTLQQQTARTVVFISHDLDEAMRIGDRIAIMQDGHIVQVGTPDDIVMNPANDYVSAFFRGVDVSQVFTAGDIASTKNAVTLVSHGDDKIDAAAERLEQNDAFFGFVHDRNRKFMGVVSLDTLNAARKGKANRLENAFMANAEPVGANTPLSDLMSTVAGAPCPLPVIDDDGRYRGVISRAGLLRVMDRTG